MPRRVVSDATTTSQHEHDSTLSRGLQVSAVADQKGSALHTTEARIDRAPVRKEKRSNNFARQSQTVM